MLSSVHPAGAARPASYWPHSPASFSPTPPDNPPPAQGWHGPLHADAQARLYLEILEESDYAQRLAPVVGGGYHDVLDVGAGSGALTRLCLGRPARWLAVEPNTAMGDALSALRPGLAAQGIDLAHLPLRWEEMPEALAAETVFAFNMGATHHEPDALFDSLAERARRAMIWVVPAQAGPSTFCLAGFLPPELHGADTTPAFERTLGRLAADQRPASIQFVDWQCRLSFTSRAMAVRHFLERLDLSSDSPHGQAVSDYINYRLGPNGEEASIVCAKRSAVMVWGF